MANSSDSVAEMPGLYGPYTMHERIVQKMWLQRDFAQTAANLTDGRRLEIRSAGRWNLLGGPDFQEAKLVIGGISITGDVEVHFHVADWAAHAHAADPAYERVVLHVVLFPPAPHEACARHADGREIPTLVLLPLLHRDLEEYASDDALEAITARDERRVFAELAAQPFAEMQSVLLAKARERWVQKVYFANVRLIRLGWGQALHATALEILGYRHNRSGMLAVAEKYPLAVWADRVDPDVVFEEFRSQWRLQGTRPANHPRVRLRQYRSWVASMPDWTERLAPRFSELPLVLVDSSSTRLSREAAELPKFRDELAATFISGSVGGTRLDNLVCDGFLPFLAAGGSVDYFPIWFHWYLGDVPDQVRRVMAKLGLADGQSQPFCHGYARGLLSWFLEREVRASS